MSNINLVFFKLDNSLSLVRELSNYYERKADFDVEFVKSYQEAGQFIATSGNAILLFKVSTKVDLQEAVAVLKGQKALIKKGLLKPACITDLKNKKVEKILAKYGCVDLLESATKAKTLSFKIDFWSRNVKTQIKKNEQEETMKLKESEAAQSAAEKARSDFEIVPALELESDIWITKAKSDYKKVLRRWLVRMLGPSPHLGSWYELEAQPNDKLPTWKFVLRDQEDKTLISDDGAWFFYGSKPEFDWKINRWIFSSDLPHLYFYNRDGSVSSRFKFVNGHVEICENSQFALTKEELILESCDSKLNFEGEKSEAEGSEELEGEDALDMSGHLEGKGSTEELDHDPLSGKSSTDEIDGDPLSGKGSTDHLDGGPLSGELTSEEAAQEDEKKDAMYRDEEIPGHMGGKSSTDHLDQSPLEGNVKPGEMKEDKESKDAMYKDDEIPGHMGGKSSTDHLDHSPLDGNVKPGEVKPGEEKKDAMYKDDEIPGHMGGKSSTDHLDHSPLDGNIKPGDVKEDQENKDAMYSEDAIPGHMGGKSSTDQLDHSPLDGNIKPGEVKPEAQGKDAAFAEDPIPGHMGGKASTDQLDHSPLDGQLKPGEVKPAANKDGSFSEDPIDGHLGGKASTDLLDHSPLDGNIKPGDVKADQAHPEVQLEKPSDAPLAGGASTDHLDHSPLDGNLKDNNEESAEGEHGPIELIDPNPGSLKKEDEDEYRPLDGNVNPGELKKESEDLSASTRTPMFEKKKEAPIGASSRTSMGSVEESSTGATRTDLSGVRKDDMMQSNPLDAKSKSITTDSEVENNMEDALGGGLTNSSSIHNSILDTDKTKGLPQVVGKAHEEVEEELDDSVGQSKESEEVEALFAEEQEDINLESGRLKVVLKQMTKAGNAITFLCEFDDFYEDELSVLAPAHSLALNSEVSASVTLRYAGTKVNVVCKGIIEEKEEFDERRETLIISLTDINKEKYETFIKLYQERQSSINDFMSRAKGY